MLLSRGPHELMACGSGPGRRRTQLRILRRVRRHLRREQAQASAVQAAIATMSAAAAIAAAAAPFDLLTHWLLTFFAHART